MQVGTTTLEISLAVPQKTLHDTSRGPCYTTPGHIYPEYSPACNKDTCSTMFIAALFIIARSWKRPRFPSVEEWIQKMSYIYTMETEHGLSNCSNSRTCIPDHCALPINPESPLLYEGIIGMYRCSTTIT